VRVHEDFEKGSDVEEHHKNLQLKYVSDTAAEEHHSQAHQRLSLARRNSLHIQKKRVYLALKTYFTGEKFQDAESEEEFWTQRHPKFVKNMRNVFLCVWGSGLFHAFLDTASYCRPSLRYISGLCSV
jgi:hypothetical protein